MKRQNDSTSSIKKRIKLLDNTHELGTIQSVTLRNFMCHDHLKFDFDPHVNFVVGQNGSGKSAVLTGIILALGGKSATTGRFSNLKGYIKTGKHKAFISVVLYNRGYSAYKKDLYGEKIIVEREISSNGSSDYKIKSESGRIVSTHKEELTSILSAMDIQVANPVLILTQENSRNFLLSKQGSDTKLYEFFYKGTGLHALEENYRQASIAREEAEKELTRKKEVLTNLKKELNRWKKYAEASIKIQEIRKELLWAGVLEMEKAVEEKSRLKDEVRENLSRFKLEKEECERNYAKVCSILKECLRKKTQHNSNVAARKSEMSNLSLLRDNSEENVTKCQGALNLYKRQETKIMEEVSFLEISMNESQIHDQSSNDTQKKRNDEEIRRLEEQNNVAVLREETLSKEREKLIEKQDSIKSDIDSLRDKMVQNEITNQSLLNDSSKLQKAIKNRQYLFSKHTPRILDEIQQRSDEFLKMPKGPIGLDVEVTDSRWATAVEDCLGRDLLCSYCCDNEHDSSILEGILTKYYNNNDIPSVIISEYLSDVHDVSEQKFPCTYPTLFDVLRIKDIAIYNCLIDQINIESVLLIDDIDTEDDIIWHSPLTNCRSILFPNSVEIMEDPRRIYYATMERNNRLLSSVNVNNIRSLENELAECTQERENLKKRINELESEFQMCSEELKKKEDELMKQKDIVARNASLINELKQSDDTRDLSETQLSSNSFQIEDLDKLKEDLERKREELNESSLNLSKYKSELQETEEKLQELRTSLEQETSMLDETESEISLSQDKKNDLESDKRRLEWSIINAEKELKYYTTALRKDEKATQKAVNAATEACPRIDTSRSLAEIRIELVETQKVLEEQSNCSLMTLPQNYEEKIQKLMQAHEELKTIEKSCKKLETMLKVREKKLKEIIKHTQYCLDLEFVVYLKSNGFNGRLNFSKTQSLSLEATPKLERIDNRKQKSCSSLSGGERSFVTLCFIIALWSRARMPFLILDEYDVFMDPQNRKSSINLLLQTADIIKSAQFIFMSPLELPELPPTTNIKIHRMAAPKRIVHTESATPMEEEVLLSS